MDGDSTPSRPMNFFTTLHHMNALAVMAAGFIVIGKIFAKKDGCCPLGNGHYYALEVSEH
jgi:hypothetical protein